MNAENGEEIVEEDVSEDQSASGSETTPGSKCYQLVKMGDSRVAVFKDTNFRVKLGHWQYFTRGTKRYGNVNERQAFCTFCDPEQQKPVCGSRPGLC
ncbi:hypothetical protein RvY_06827-4 [Ramazzottius varieornatus]|uniref:Uncharacterized protein n=1 Tax=Ramazzottius varieornatus TaxID=947166 RepID=A0A1D1V375_RAMVA|nr:hypothetical protein RvY_06827-4 [Ramazzottius varieornatus]